MPFGDFAFLKKLPAMYRNCKETEDRNMTPFDFITDHLVNFDCLFDKHNDGDEQKPHNPPQDKENSTYQQVYKFEVNFVMVLFIQKQELNFTFIEHKHPIDFNNSIFRPPIFC
jgi:hypothetical protein